LTVILKPNQEQPDLFPVESHWKQEFKLREFKFKAEGEEFKSGEFKFKGLDAVALKSEGPVDAA